MTGVLYASLLEFKQFIAIPDEASDVDLERALETASRKVDHECGRVFSLQTAQTRLYYPDDPWNLQVVDLVTPTSIKVDTEGDRTYATTLATTDYQLWPLNGPRYQLVYIWPLADEHFLPGRLVQVNGTFGCVEEGRAPMDVVQSTLILAARYYKRSEAPFGILQTTDLGQYTRISQSDPDVATLLEPWRLTKQWIAV